MEASEALEKLKEGNKRFTEGSLTHPNQDQAARTKWNSSQEPWAIVLSCADSRVIPEAAFDTGVSDLFVCRVAGNVANTDTIASIEYAVAHLGTKLIVVMGHEACGAVGAALAGGDNGYNLNILLSQIGPAIAASPNAPVSEVVKTNARLNAEEMVKRSAIISGAVENGGLKIVSAYYNLDSGVVDFLD
ncbi:MAG: carbonic anhydrase [Cytophagales bacterium]|nr:carbonic anhydrase [Cytophagales bacterium]